MKRALSTILLLVGLAGIQAHSQTLDYEAVFGKAKESLTAERYKAASDMFLQLINFDPANKRGAYSRFYYAVCKYYLGDIQLAKDSFLELTKEQSEWDKLPEVYLWISKIYFELDSPNQGLYYAELAGENPSLYESVTQLKKGYLAALDTATLRVLLEEGNSTDLAAICLTKKLLEVNANKRDYDRIDSLISTFGLDSAELGLSVPEDIFKDRYNVAVMLPLFADRMWARGVYLQKSLAVDIYEGIRMALEEFDTTRINLIVFDTKKDAAITKNIILSNQLHGMDAVIGPLYPDPLTLVSNYAMEHKINFVSPVSTNSSLIEHNPYGFLIRTGSQSMGKRIADFTKARLDTGAFAIYYGPRVTDSLVASNYEVQMKADSFYLTLKQRAETSTARKIFDSLTSSKEVVDTAALELILRENGKMPRFLPMTDSLYIKRDSLGHIFIASDNKAISSEVMAAVTYRGDTTQLIGVGNWFSTPNASLEQMDKLGVWLAMQDYENMLSPENIALSERYRNKYHQKPGKYFFFGYYSMKFLGESLLKYGVYFQNGYRSQGSFDPLFEFSDSQDNQRLNVYKIENGKIIKLSMFSDNEVKE